MDNYDLNDLIEAEYGRLDNYEWLFEAEDEVDNDETI